MSVKLWGGSTPPSVALTVAAGKGTVCPVKVRWSCHWRMDLVSGGGVLSEGVVRKGTRGMVQNMNWVDVGVGALETRS